MLSCSRVACPTIPHPRPLAAAEFGALSAGTLHTVVIDKLPVYNLLLLTLSARRLQPIYTARTQRGSKVGTMADHFIIVKSLSTVSATWTTA